MNRESESGSRRYPRTSLGNLIRGHQRSSAERSALTSGQTHDLSKHSRTRSKERRIEKTFSLLLSKGRSGGGRWQLQRPIYLLKSAPNLPVLAYLTFGREPTKYRSNGDNNHRFRFCRQIMIRMLKKHYSRLTRGSLVQLTCRPILP